MYNKIDSIPLEEVDRMSRTPLSLTISCELSLKCVSTRPSSSLDPILTCFLRLCSLDGLLEGIWQELALVKIYTKKRGDQPDLTDPICMRRGSTIEVRPSSSCFAS